MPVKSDGSCMAYIKILRFILHAYQYIRFLKKSGKEMCTGRTEKSNCSVNIEEGSKQKELWNMLECVFAV